MKRPTSRPVAKPARGQCGLYRGYSPALRAPHRNRVAYWGVVLSRLSRAPGGVQVGRRLDL